MDRLSYIKDTWRTGHYAVAGALWFMVVFFGVVFRNFGAIAGFHQTTSSLGETALFALTLTSGITTLLSPIGAISLIVFGLLLGMNAVLLWQYIGRKRRQTICIDYAPNNHGVAISGTVASLFGIGCAACGSAILFAILNIIGAGGLLLWLPLHGEEFSIIGIVLLSYATWALLGKMYQTRPNITS